MPRELSADEIAERISYLVEAVRAAIKELGILPTGARGRTPLYYETLIGRIQKHLETAGVKSLSTRERGRTIVSPYTGNTVNVD